MESITPSPEAAAAQLREVESARASLFRRSTDLPFRMYAVMGIGAFLFFATFDLENDSISVVASVLWPIFVLLWVRWGTRLTRVRVGYRHAPPEAKVRLHHAWVVSFVGTGVLTFTLGPAVSFSSVGASIGLLIVVGGLWLSKR